ncbi:MAG TPA: DMT family transporter [Gemmatimonadales bacterium]|nr:DMT family transporter [Gemmatimonadales bacterium]
MSLLLVAAILVGMGLPLQAGINAQLRLGLGHPLLAALVSFAVGTLALALATLLLRLSFPPATALAQIAWWQWTGGLIGAVYIFAAVILAPRLGATALIGAIVAGQMVASLVYDHFGVAGFPVQPVTLPRIVGVLLIGAGVWLVQRRF